MSYPTTLRATDQKLERPHRVLTRAAPSVLFERLDCEWRFEPGPSPNTTSLAFSLDFQFASRLYNSVADVFFGEVVERMVGAFERRCEEVYGSPGRPVDARSYLHLQHVGVLQPTPQPPSAHEALPSQRRTGGCQLPPSARTSDEKDWNVL